MRAAPLQRAVYLTIGWTCVGLGFVGLWLPLMPTTVFLLVACWAFARSSPRLHAWLMDHPRFGRWLSDWHDHGTIPPAAKWSAVIMMAASFAIVLVTTNLGTVGTAVLAVLLAGCAAYIITRPSSARSSAVLDPPGSQGQ